jgi:hypothetical protein
MLDSYNQTIRILSICLLILFGIGGPVFADGNLDSTDSAGATFDDEQEGYEPFRGWRQAETEHFIFIFEERDEPAVRELISVAEEVYDSVTSFFGSYPPKIRCLVLGRIDSINGSFSTAPNMITIYATPPSTPFLWIRTESWLRTALIHELTHYVNLTYRKGPWYVVGRIFGPTLYSSLLMAFMPGWLAEGITTNTETIFTDGGRGRNPFFEIYSKAAAVEGKMFDWMQATFASPFQPRNRIYLAGYLMVDYIIRHYGPEAYLSIFRRYAMFPFFGPYLQTKSVTGYRVGQLFMNMYAELRDRYAHEMMIPAGEVVVSGEAVDAYPKKAVDGGILFYRRTLKDRSAVMRLNLETGDMEELFRTSLTDTSSFDAVPDSSKVVFARLEPKGPHEVGTRVVSDLHLWNSDSNRIRRLTTNSHVWQPTISDDGARIIAVQRSGIHTSLIEVDEATGTIHRLFSPGDAIIMNPDISPSGDSVVFTMNRRGVQDIYLLSLSEMLPGEESSSTRPKRITGPDQTARYYPSFVSESRIIYTTDETGSLTLRVLDLDEPSSTPIPVSEDPVGTWIGIVSGSDIYYGTYRTNGFEIRRSRLPLPPSPSPSPTQKTDSASSDETVSTTPSPDPAHLGISADTERHQPANTLRSRRFVDFPLPYMWLLSPIILQHPEETPSYGVAVEAAGSSYTGANAWTLSIGLLPLELQLIGSFGVNIRLGPITTGYAFSQSYGRFPLDESTYFWAQDTQQSISVGIPLVSHRGYHTATDLTFSTSFNALYRMYADDTFRLGQGDDDGWNCTVGAGLLFRNAAYSPVRAMFGRWAIQTLLIGQYSLPVLDEPNRDDLVLKGGLSFNIPLPPHLVLKFGGKVGYDPYLPATTITPTRGGFLWENTDVPVSVLAAVDFLFPILTVDWGLPMGFHITALGAGVHVEGLGGFAADGSPQFDSTIYAGFELMVRAEIGRAHV